MPTRDRDIVLFDGECAYCNGWVRWITARDRHHRFHFVPRTSDEGLAVRAQQDIPENIDSIVLVQGGQAYFRSDAAWRILRELPGWGGAGLALRLVPRFLRDRGYDLVAKNRHRLGLDDSCELPKR